MAKLILYLLLKLDPGNIPRLQEASLNGTVLAFAVATMFLTSLLTGIMPAVAASRVNLIEFLKSGGQTGAKGERSRFRNVLIVAQVAIVVILLTGSGLLVKSPIKLQEVPLGFSATTLSMKIDLPKSYSKPEQRESFYRTLLSQLSALPGTLTAGAKRQKLLNFHYAEDVRYRERTTLKRVNARLKDEFCGRSVRVRGNAKVILCSASFGWPQIRF